MDNKDHELSLFLFLKCNLRCKFCFQNHTNDIDIEAIKNIPKLLEDNYPEELKNPELETVSLSIKGGELFADDIPDSMFVIYEELVNDIIALIRSYIPDIKFKVLWVSNGVNTKPERIMKLFNKIENIGVMPCLGLSYDPIGRFKTKDQFKLFENTFWYFYNNYKVHPKIGYTLTKRNINILINNEDEFLNNIPNDIRLDPCYYIANTVNDINLPNDDDLFNFYKWAIDNNKYQFDVIRGVLDTIYFDIPPNEACVSGKNTTYYNGTIRHNCEMFVLPYEYYFGQYTKDVTPDNITNMKYRIGIDKRGCLICEYKNICPGMCWCSMIFDEYEITECFLKSIFKYLYDHPEIKEKYMEYKKDEYKLF